jgi:hypothetical protein
LKVSLKKVVHSLLSYRASTLKEAAHLKEVQEMQAAQAAKLAVNKPEVPVVDPNATPVYGPLAPVCTTYRHSSSGARA